MDRATPHGIYTKVVMEFQKLLKVIEMDQRKDGLQRRRKITLHSLRRHAKTVISTQVGQDYSEWFLGHSKSPYWTMKETQRREIYVTKIVKYLTFLDYSHLETDTKNAQDTLAEKDKIKRKYLEEWVEAVAEDGRFGKWVWDIAFEQSDVRGIVNKCMHQSQSNSL